MKRTVPVLITFLIGLTLAIAYFTPFVGDLGEMALIHFDILAAIAFILGGGNLLRSHGEKIFKRRAGWGYSLIAVVTFVLTLGVGLAKVGVSAPPGMWTDSLLRSGQTVAFARLNVTYTDDKRDFALETTIRKAEPGTTADVLVDGTRVGQLKVNEEGRADGKLEFKYDEAAQSPEYAALAKADDAHQAKLTVGDLSGALVAYGPILGEFNSNGSWFWWLYEYWFKPLQQTTFAMLAFYVASAAFRAFRAKNIESLLLLGTAFIILLGQTFVGTLLTQGLPEHGFLSFFVVPNLKGWIMSVFNTAGNRAIMIGIALGIASTSLKVIFGIDRSYLGSE